MQQHAFRATSVLLSAIYLILVALHLPYLSLPYFWDEAGFYIPAARDLFLDGSLIPRSTLLTGHPPLSAVYLALCWSLFGYAPLVSRLALLLASSFGLVQVFRLAERLANREVALATTVLTALYPVVFAQSALAHADTLATALSLWALNLYFKDDASRWRCMAAFSLAALAKETAIVIPASLMLWEVLASRWPRLGARPPGQRGAFSRSAGLVLCAVPLALWFGFHYVRTGHIFGGQDFFHYNVSATLHPLRFGLALVQRLWQVLGHMNLYVLTISGLSAMLLVPREDFGVPRPRIAVPLQMALAVVIFAQVFFHSLVGGAVLARYMMPAIPLVILIWTSTLWRRVRYWQALVMAIALAFIAGWWVNPPYRFAPEDNLNYADYVRLHEDAAAYIEAHHRTGRVLTAWPASDELARPFLGYVAQPVNVVRIENFSREQIELASRSSDYDVALLFSTKAEPPRKLLHWQWWDARIVRFFDYHRDLSPEVMAAQLGGKIVMQQSRNGQWVAVVTFDRIRNARLDAPPAAVPSGISRRTSFP
ncbi:MAG: glycosyltransferase family 39 protein [Acidobacteriales bacterium]|nr:glycosyltransferase family 39 protein [Terriglobales bacterium]